MPNSNRYPARLISSRLIMRPFCDGDRAFIVELLNEHAFIRYIGDKGVRNGDDAARYLELGPFTSYRTHGFGMLAVEEAGDNATVGMCGLIWRENQDCPDIGYAFLSRYHGLGYATEAASTVLRHAHDVLAIPRVLAFVDPENERSISLLVKLGMREIGMTLVSGIPDSQKTFESVANR